MRLFRRTAEIAVFSVVVSFAGACTLQEAPRSDSTAVAASQARTGRGWNPDTYRAPVVDSTPDDAYATSVYRGLALLTHTRDSLPAYVGGSLNCTSCHLDEGRRPNAIPLTGVAARFPRFIEM